MKSVKVKGFKFKLIGDLIEKDSQLEFKAKDKDNKDISINDIKGVKVISIFPSINTKVCDSQTQLISRYATKYPKIKFISISMDTIETINEWCASHSIDNIDIWSDKEYGEFGINTNSIIKRVKKLTRGILILDKDNKVVEASWNIELSKEPDYSVIDSIV